MTPKEWYDMTIGKSYNTDGAYGYQCWDYFDYFKKFMKLDKMSTYCASTGYAGDIWKLRNSNGASIYFDFITPNNIKEGDWLFWNKHVAFYYQGREVGQNQIFPKYKVTSMTLNRNGILGAFRYKRWKTTAGVAECYASKYVNTYVTTTAVNLRAGGSVKYPIIVTLPARYKVSCYGYYHMEQGVPWLYVAVDYNGERLKGFICSKYLEGV